jgi:hypothetical protein
MVQTYVGPMYTQFVVGLVLIPLANGGRRASLEVGLKGKVFAAVGITGISST